MREYIKKYAKPVLAVLGVIIGVLTTIHLIVAKVRKNHILNIHDDVEDDNIYDEIEPMMMANTSKSMSVEECEKMESDLNDFWKSVEDEEDDETEPVSKNKKAKRKKKSDSKEDEED